jgi:hypothetical protein
VGEEAGVALREISRPRRHSSRALLAVITMLRPAASITLERSL